MEAILDYVTAAPATFMVTVIIFVAFITALVGYITKSRECVILKSTIKVMEKTQRNRFSGDAREFRKLNHLFEEMFELMSQLEERVKKAKGNKEKRQLYHIIDTLAEKRTTLMCSSTGKDSSIQDAEDYVKLIKEEVVGIYVDKKEK